MLCCVAHSYLGIKQIEAACLLFVDIYWHYITLYILCIQNNLLCLGLLSYNRHMRCATKSFIDKIQEFKDINSVEALKAGI